MVQNQPTLLLKVVSGSVGMQHQESVSMSVARIIIKIRTMTLVWEAAGVCIDVQGPYTADPTHHCPWLCG